MKELRSFYQSNNLYYDKKSKSILSVLVENIFPALTYILFIISIGLQKVTEMKEGIESQVISMNNELTSSILTENSMDLFKYFSIAVIIICSMLLLLKITKSNKNSLFSKKTFFERYRFRYLIFTVLSCGMLFLMLFYYSEVSWIAYPLIVVSALIIVVIQLIRIIFVTFTGAK